MSKNRRPVLVHAALAVSAMCFVAACGGSQDAPPETTTPPSNEISIAVPDVTTAVLDAGSEPRAVVAPAPNGDEQNVTLVTESDVLQSIGAQPRQDFSDRKSVV